MKTSLSNSHLVSIIKETLEGSDQKSTNSAFADIPTEIKLAIAKNLIQKNSDDRLKDNYWKILFHRKPPTIREFLSKKWLGKELANDVYPLWKKISPVIFSPEKIINELILYGSVGRGKSFISALYSQFLEIRLWCMHNPYKFYGRSPINPFAFYLSSFTEKKGKQVVLKPILNAFEANPFFQKVKYEDHLLKQDPHPDAPILYTTASTIGCISLSRNLHYAIGSNVSHQLGLTLIGALVSEINFFIEQGGVTASDIWKYYNTLKTRIYSRFGRQYGALLILDSSANDMENPIEEYILGDAKRDPSVYISSETHWEAMPDIYPIFEKTGETFGVFKGTKGKEPFILNENNLTDEIESKDILNVPIDAFKQFDTDIYTALKDLAGIATGAKIRFFPNEKFLTEMFNCNLKPCPTIEAPISKDPESLIFNQVLETDNFFEQDISGKYYIKRASNAPRAIHLDLATSDKGDNRSGCCVKHLETGNEGKLIAVTDFAFPISGSGEQISITALEHFVYDLMFIGRVPITCVSADGFQSSQLLENIKRKFQQRIKDKQFFCKLISCDRQKVQYYLLKTFILQGKQKNASNKYLLNNYQSLEELPKKIDHTDGDATDSAGNYTGKHAKDISDAEAGALYHLIEHYTESAYSYSDCENYSIDKEVNVIKSTFKSDGKLSLKDNLKRDAIERAKIMALEEINRKK